MNIVQRAMGRLARYRNLIRFTDVGDGLAVRFKNMRFRDHPDFKAAWHQADEWSGPGFVGGFPDIRWRAHVAIWCAKNAIRLDGDFVECGVHAGLLSAAICKSVDLAAAGKAFFLFDTFEGIPVSEIDDTKAANKATETNRIYYRDTWALVSSTFGQLPYAKLVRGKLPGTLSQAMIDKIAYLSIDLNVAVYERQVIEALWDKLVPGAFVLFDDYAFEGHEAQYNTLNEFAATKDRLILTLPTGQGLLIK